MIFTKKLTALLLLLITCFSINAKMTPFLELKKMYGDYMGKPVLIEGKDEVLLSYKKTINNVPRYTLLLFDGINAKKINNFPKIPRPFWMDSLAKVNGKTLPPRNTLEYYGTCFNFKGKIIVGFGDKNTSNDKNPESLQMFLYSYENGKFSPFMLSSRYMNILSQTLGKKVNDLNTIDFFTNVLISSENYMVLNASARSKDGYKTGYHYFDGEELTYLYKSSDNYMYKEQDGSKNLYKESDIVHMVEKNGKLFSIVQESKHAENALVKSSHAQKLISKEFHMFDMVTKKDIVLTHNALLTLDKETTKSNDYYYLREYVKDYKSTLKEIQLELRVVGNEAIFSGILTNQKKSPLGNKFEENGRRAIFYFNNQYNELRRYPLKYTNQPYKNDGFIGCLGKLNNKHIFAFVENKANVENRISFRESKNSTYVKTPRPMSMQGYRFELNPYSEPIPLSGKLIFHYISNSDYDTHFSFDGDKFQLYTGFQYKNKGKANREGFPQEIFKIKDKYFFTSGRDKNFLCSWTFDQSEFVEGNYR